jgi:hypothetical protein
MKCLSKSIGVMFLFVFPQFPSAVEHDPTLITSHIRRTVSCSKSCLWRSHLSQDIKEDREKDKQEDIREQETINGVF